MVKQNALKHNAYRAPPVFIFQNYQTHFMKLLLLLSLWNTSALPAFTDSLPKKTKIFKATIATNSTGQNETGYLYSITDSTINLADVPLSKNPVASGNPVLRSYNYANINYIRLKPKGSAGRGALYGALVGAVTGIISGVASGDDDPTMWFAMTAGEKAFAAGTFLALVGGLIGLVTGSFSHKKFRIDGNRQKFQKMKTTLLKKAYGIRQD